MALRCTWEYLGKISANIAGLVDTGRASGSTSDKPGRADEKPGCIWMHQPQTSVCRQYSSVCQQQASQCWRYPWKHWRQAWEHLQILWSRLGKTSSLGTLQVCLEIIASTYHLPIFKTPVFSFFSHRCMYIATPIHSVSELAARGD